MFRHIKSAWLNKFKQIFLNNKAHKISISFYSEFQWEVKLVLECSE